MRADRYRTRALGRAAIRRDTAQALGGTNSTLRGQDVTMRTVGMWQHTRIVVFMHPLWSEIVPIPVRKVHYLTFCDVIEIDRPPTSWISFERGGAGGRGQSIVILIKVKVSRHKVWSWAGVVHEVCMHVRAHRVMLFTGGERLGTVSSV